MSAARSSHPYFFHDAVLEEADAFGAVLDATQEDVAALASKLDPAGRLFLVGIGTSLHAARVAEAAFQRFAPHVDVRTAHSFDFATAGPQLRDNDCVVAVSHRGNKRYSAESLERATAAGALTALVTGQNSKLGDGARPEFLIETVRQDPSAAHTVSYVGAAAALLSLVHKLAPPPQSDALRDALQRLGEAIRHGVENEDAVKRTAAAEAHARRIWVTGAGADGVTAQEIALKIKETSFSQAEGMGIEELLHGPFQASEANDLFLVIDTGQPGRARTHELVPMALRIGASVLVVGIEELPGATDFLPVAPAPAPLGTLAAIGTLHLYTYHLALSCGTNPDAFRLDDATYAAAYKMASL